MKKIILPTLNNSPAKYSIVISSGLYLIRNIDGISFPEQLSESEKKRINEQLLTNIPKIVDINSFSIFDIQNLSTEQQQHLGNELVLSSDSVKKTQFIVASNDGSWVFIPNLLNHIMFYSLSYGLSLKYLYKNLNTLLTELDSHIHYAYSTEFGFLSSNINFSGNGLICTVLLNLTYSELKGQIESLVATCRETGYTLSPYINYPNCPLYTLEINNSFGISELDHIDHMTNLIQQIQQNEQKAKKEILEDEENKELFVTQINSLLQESEISYEQACHIITMTDALDNFIYTIQNKQSWRQLLFSLKDSSEKFTHLSEEDKLIQRANLLKSYFASSVSFKRS